MAEQIQPNAPAGALAPLEAAKSLKDAGNA
jgi:peptidylprolyl isomerase